MNCDNGRSLQNAIDRFPNRRLRVEFKGTCVESVTIARNGVTLVGVGEEATVVGQVAVKSAIGVRLEGFTVRDTPAEDPVLDRDGDGVRVLASTGVEISGVEVINAGARGFSFERSSVDIRDSSTDGAKGIGFIAFAATVDVAGTFASRDSAVNGICIVAAASLFVLPNSTIVAERNPLGIIVEELAVMTVALGSQVVANDNFGDGIQVIGQGALLYASAAIEATNNGRYGIAVTLLSHFTAFGGSVIDVEVANNGAGGMIITSNSAVVAQGGFTVRDNGGFGILADNAVLGLAGVTSTDNPGGDVVAGFGSKVVFAGSSNIGTISCDPTVLVRGGQCDSAANGAAALEAVPADLLLPSSLRGSLGVSLSR